MEARYLKLKDDWSAGCRNRDLGLELMFFAWMHWADPPAVTGLADDPFAPALWHEIFEYFGGENSHDVEFLFISSLMSKIFPYVLGNEDEWIDRSDRMLQKVQKLEPAGISKSIFADRGEYGTYFAHHASLM